MEAKDWTWKASLKSDQYQGAFLLMSAMRPPKSFPVLFSEMSS